MKVNRKRIMADVNNITEYASELLRRKTYQLDRLKEELEDAESTLEFTFSSRVEDAIQEQIENIKEDIEETQKRIAKLETIIESGVDPVRNIIVEKFNATQNDGYIACATIQHESNDSARYFIDKETYNGIRGVLKEHYKGIDRTWFLPDWEKLDIAIETVDITKVNRK